MQKTTAIRILIALAVFTAIFCTGYGLGIRNAGGTGANGVGTNDGSGRVAEQLGQAERAQRQLTADLRSAEESNHRLADELGRGAEAVGRGAKAADSIAAANSDIDRELAEARSLIDRSQRIIERVLGRAKADQAPH